MWCCRRNCIAVWLLIGGKPPCPGGRAGSSLDQQLLTCYVVGFTALSSTQVAHPHGPDACQPKTGVLRGSTLPNRTDTFILSLAGVGAIEKLCGFFPRTTQQVPVPPKTLLFGANVYCMLLRRYVICCCKCMSYAVAKVYYCKQHCAGRTSAVTGGADPRRPLQTPDRVPLSQQQAGG